MTMTFAKEMETRVDTVPEVIELLSKKYRFDCDKVYLQDLGITEDYHVIHDSKDYEITNRGFRKFLGKLGIPPRFGMKVPEDLLDTIVKRLREVKNQELQLFTKRGVIYGMESKRYQPPDLEAILQPLNDMKRDVKMVRVGSEGFRMASLGPQIIMPRDKDKKDQIQVGIYITACAIGRPYPHARLMTFRHICSNGVVSGRELGEVIWPKGLPDDESAEQFFVTSLDELVKKEARLIEPVKVMANRQMLDREFSNLWRYLKKTVGTERADKILEATEDDRRKIIAAARANRKQHKKPEPITVCSAYQAFNNISAYANDLPGASAEKLQVLAGSLLGKGRTKLAREEEEDED